MNARYYDPQIKRFISADEIGYLGANGDLNSYNLYAYCNNNPVNMYDSNGNWPKWNEFKNWISNKWNMLVTTVEKTTDIIFTSDFVNQLDDIVLSNIEADAGICIGVGFEDKFGDFGVEAVSRMDIIGIQFRNGEMTFGKDGRSALAISGGVFTIGPQNDTFEIDSKREVEDTSYFGVGISYGKSAAFFIGYHYNFSVSFSGMAIDIKNYIKQRW